MLRRSRLLAALLICLVLLPLPSMAVPGVCAETESVPYGAPALIIENVGQWDPAARFQVWGGPGTTWLAEDAIWITLSEPAPADDPRDRVPGREPLTEAPRAEARRKGVNLRLSFEGANPHPTLVPFGESETVVSYFLGNDPDQWHADVPVWAGVRYVDLYPGLDLEVRGTSGSWAWRMVAGQSTGLGEITRPGGVSLQDVRLRVEGAEALVWDGATPRLQTLVGDVSLPPLRAVDASGAPVALPGQCPETTVDDGTLPSGAHEAAAMPTDDATTLRYSTFLGGAEVDAGRGITSDRKGRACVVGFTASTGFPTTAGAFDISANGDEDAYVSLLNPAGTSLVCSTFIGGSSSERATGVALDLFGDIYVTGFTYSSDYPTTEGAYDRSHAGDADAFVSVLLADGSGLGWSTLLGGSGEDVAESIATDTWYGTYITGHTRSTNYPTVGAYDNTHNGGDDVFVSVLDPSGFGLLYSSYLGGSGNDLAFGIGVFSLSGDLVRVYVTGRTGSANYPTTAGALDRSYAGGDAFITAIETSDGWLHYSTLLGGSATDEARGIALDSDGRAHIVGQTQSANFPVTVGAYDTSFAGDQDIFVSVLDYAGSALVGATLLGGSTWEEACGIALDRGGRHYVTGYTDSSDYPTTAGAYDSSRNGGNPDPVVSMLDGSLSSLLYSTYLGGSDHDEACGIAIPSAGRVYITGYTNSADYPATSGAFDTSYDGNDAFVSAVQVLPFSTHFDAASEWWDGLISWAPQNRYPRLTGDVDGDGDDDVVAFNPIAGAYVALSTGTALEKPVQWTTQFAWLQGKYNWRALGDVDGDSKQDIVGFLYDGGGGGGGGVYVALSTGQAFSSSSEWLNDLETWGPQGTYPRLVGDADGDGRADVVAIDPTNGVYVALSTGSAFSAKSQWSAQTGWMSDARNWVALGDVDGDGDADLVNWRYGEGVHVALSDGASYGVRTLWLSGMKFWGPDDRYPRLVGDVTGDGKADVVAWNPDSGGWVGVSTGTAFVKPAQWTTEFAIRPNAYYLHTLGDMDGDGRDDAVLFWYGEGVYVGLSSWE